MVSADVEQQHEAGVGTTEKDSPVLGAGDNNSDVQVDVPAVEAEENTPSTETTVPPEQLEEPRADENAPEAVASSEVAPQSSEDPVNTEPILLSETSTAAGPSKSPPEQCSKGRPQEDSDQHQSLTVANDTKPAVLVETPSVECQPEATSDKVGLKDPEPTSQAHADDVEQDDVELTPQQSSESLPAKPPGFLESLTANFAPDTKAMWARIFGPRYDDGDEEEGLQADTQSNAGSTRESVSSKSSLQAKLARERNLDEQIQASQRRYRERVLRAAAANNTATMRGRVKNPSRPQRQAPTVSPLERAGLSLTQIRFCTEKALDETCKCFRHLHAAALEEVEDPAIPPTQGIYITQGELDLLLRDLFDPRELELSNTKGRKGTLAAPVDFATNGDGISMNTQLQASWFIPFGQLPQLRSLVMKITKRHLNQDKLAIVSRHLQKQLTLLPHSAKVQNLVLQLANHQMKDPPKAPAWPEREKPSDELAQELLGCIVVNEATTSTERENYKNFLLFLPVDLVAKTQLPSVVCAQRLVFFRYLIGIIAAERTRLHSKLTDSPSQAFPVEPPPKRKTLAGKRRSSSKRIPSDHIPESDADPPVQDGDQPANEEDSASVHAAHGSLSSPPKAPGVYQTPAESNPFEQSSMAQQVGDECEKPASHLQQQLESAISQLRQTVPTIDADIKDDAILYAFNPAIRATYLAAVACHQSVLLLLENNIDVDTAMSKKLQHFIKALQAIQTQATDAKLLVPASPQLKAGYVAHQVHDPPRFPPPYPESTVPDEDDEESENGSAQTHFPPPYALTTPSYWTFTPSIPAPKSSIVKLASTSPCNNSADLRSHFMSKESPGVGAYNIQQGEKLTFQQKPSYSFGPTGAGTSGGGSKAPGPVLGATSLSKGSHTGKPSSSRSTLRQRMKTSLAFVPPMVQPPEDNDVEWPTNASTRVHVASQFDDSHLGTSSTDDLLSEFPPHYNAGDANESAGVDDPSVETDMDRALRLQQRLFMDEFVQQVVSNQESPTYFVPRVKHKTESTHRPSSTKSKPYWATSEVSPGIERLLHRQRRAPSSSARSRPPPAATQPRATRTAQRVATKGPPPSPPPRRQLDNDLHLAWAARISELYQPAESGPEQ
ncbi:hypothetical protein PHYPSEUDO_013445 [Phytophthora pseudosyringae]|uniref:Uncharacterized protein n=1 Tax=Phytophthora pseudosyringae TaxID=221518 RepID=A0A8T1WGK9_9STRA|nr:hypothetical protein PHYPSEUDO_013445 [Phytophthora pseudosyringae]